MLHVSALLAYIQLQLIRIYQDVPILLPYWVGQYTCQRQPKVLDGAS